jgi:hypothetical protein
MYLRPSAQALGQNRQAQKQLLCTPLLEALVVDLDARRQLAPQPEEALVALEVEELL